MNQMMENFKSGVANLDNGLLVAGVGLITVFAVLIMLWIILEVMHVIVAATEKKSVKAPVAEVQPTKAPANKQASKKQAPKKNVKLAPLPQGDPKEDKQFVAAVMGAIAAHDGADSFDFKIKSIKKL